MNKFIAKAFDWLVESFRTPTPEEAVEQYLRTYGARMPAAEPLHRALPIGHADAMSLCRGATHTMMYLGKRRWATHVYDAHKGEELPIFTAFGGTYKQSNDRALQLLSALDGARRL